MWCALHQKAEHAQRQHGTTNGLCCPSQQSPLGAVTCWGAAASGPGTIASETGDSSSATWLSGLRGCGGESSCLCQRLASLAVHEWASAQAFLYLRMKEWQQRLDQEVDQEDIHELTSDLADCFLHVRNNSMQGAVFSVGYSFPRISHWIQINHITSLSFMSRPH